MTNTYHRRLKTGQPLAGGLRKRCFLSDNSVLCLWPKGSLPFKKIIRTIELENELSRMGLPVRRWRKIGSGWLKEIRFENNDYWLGEGSYLTGNPTSIWSIKKLQSAGKMLARLHRVKRKKQSLLHLDFARSNLLFDQKNRLVGVLDFEEADFGLVEKDLACSLSFFVVDTPSITKAEIFDNFLTGYKKAGGLFDYGKIEKYYSEYLNQRMKENPDQNFINDARHRLSQLRSFVQSKILTEEKLAEFRTKNRGKSIVLTVGAYELLHWGHLQFLKKAKSLSDLLIVAVASDESRRRLKGEPHPLITDRTRAETLAHFPFVDAVFIAPEDDIRKELRLLKPKFLFATPEDWQDHIRRPDEAELVKNWGGQVIKCPSLGPKVSSSKMVEKVALMKIQQLLSVYYKRLPMLKLGRRRQSKMISFSDLNIFNKQQKKQGKTIVFTSGTADLFHLGHARYFQKAKSLGDTVVIGVPSNKSVKALKGPGRPMVDEKARAWVIAELDWVDKVVIFDERSILGCLKKLKPDVFLTIKEDWNTGFLTSPEAVFLKSISAKIVRSEMQAPFLSASKIINKTAGELIKKRFAEILKAASQIPVLDADNGFDPHSPQAQLTARERGFYEQVLSAVAKRGKCVFCDLKEKYLLVEKDNLVLTVALFPYADGHLLIIPRRHIERITDLTQKEQRAVFELAQKGTDILRRKLGVENTWFLLREGKGIKVGKTVDHLHFHLIPYGPNIIKMGETPLTITPLALAKKLRGK